MRNDRRQRYEALQLDGGRPGVDWALWQITSIDGVDQDRKHVGTLRDADQMEAQRAAAQMQKTYDDIRAIPIS